MTNVSFADHVALEERVKALEDEMCRRAPEHPLVAGFNRFRAEATRREEARREQAE